MIQTIEPGAVEPRATGTCAKCGHVVERSDEYLVDVGGRDVLFVSDRCPECGSEYINAPSILIPDRPLLAAFEPGATPIGTYRHIVSVTSRDPDFRGQPEDKVAATILGYLFDKDLADAVLLAHQGWSEEPVVALTKGELVKAWQIRMGPGRAVATGSGLRANLLTLAQIKTFAERDRAEHTRVAVMGRPCQVYTSRKLLWDEYVPGYNLVFVLGTFCYGNFTPAAWGGRHLRQLLGFDPSEIRGVRFSEEELQFTSAGRAVKSLPVSEVAGLVNANCLQCYDFSGMFSDLSVGHVGAEDDFERAILRTALGVKVFEGAVRDGYLAKPESMYGTENAAAEERNAARFLAAMVNVKREMTRALR